MTSTGNDLSKFEVTVQCGDCIEQPVVLDFSEGRFFHARGSVPSRIETLQFPSFFLSENSGSRADCIRKIIGGLAEGFVIKTSPHLDLWGMRFCDAHVYYLNNETDNTSEPSRKMVKEEEVCLFSYLTYITKLLKHKAETTCIKDRPSYDVKLVVGSRPKTPLDRTFLSILIKPLVVERLHQLFDFPDEAASLLFSNKDSTESLIDSLRNCPEPQPMQIFDSLLYI